MSQDADSYMDKNWPMRYDIETDSRVPVTQQDWDEIHEFVMKMTEARSAFTIPEEDQDTRQAFKFQLALYPNPMQPGKVWLAEAKEIIPYEDAIYRGRALFPVVPKTQFVVGSTIELEFAAELARRWNRVPGSY